MHDREPAMLKRLLDRLHDARSRRDAEPRFSDGWREADAVMHDIERAIFRSPFDMAAESARIEASAPRSLRRRASASADSPQYSRNRAG
jgi:hypothetical protein